MMGFLTEQLTPQKMLAFFLSAVFLFAYPLILADSFYIDDNWRAQLAGMEWRSDGRILVGWLYQGLSFTAGAPNMFPLALLVAIGAMAFALRSLTLHYFTQPTIASCLVVLPLWYSPFFLQNLSYQYDGPAMSLGVVAIIYGICFFHSSWWIRALLSAVFIAAGLSLYQMVINVYLGLLCVELLRAAVDNQHPGQIFRLARDKTLHLALGVGLYLMTAHQLIQNDRKVLRALRDGWFGRLLSDLQSTAQRVSLLYHDGNAWLCWSLLTLAGVGLCLVVYRVTCLQAGKLSRALAVGICLATVPIMLISIPGLMLVFNFYNEGARLLMGVSSALVMVFYLAYHTLTFFGKKMGCLLIIPLIAMLSFSYMYGRVLSLQKDLSISVGQGLAYELFANRELTGVGHFYLVNYSTYGWLVGSDGSVKLVPALRYILNVDFVLLSEMLPRMAGINNVSSLDKPAFEATGIKSTNKSVVDNKFYSIYVLGSLGYIVMKTVSADDKYQ